LKTSGDKQIIIDDAVMMNSTVNIYGRTDLLADSH